jgi:hypothetical protein
MLGEGFHVEAEYGAGGREEGFHHRVTETQRKRKEEEKDLTRKGEEETQRAWAATRQKARCQAMM